MGGDAGGQPQLKEFDELAERAIYHTEMRRDADRWGLVFGIIAMVLLGLSFWKETFTWAWLLSLVTQFFFMGANFKHTKNLYDRVNEMHDLGEQLGMSHDQIHAQIDKVMKRKKQQ